MIVRRLGNGNAFTPEITNTSFTLADDRILVDCGYNVFKKIKELYLEDKIKYVFITHAHDDHIGSLMAFLYYREFIVKKPINVYVNKQTYDILKQFNVIYQYPNIYKPMKYVKFNVLEEKGRMYFCDDKAEIVVDYLEVNSHGAFKNTVYKFWIKKIECDKVNVVVITGDTKANKEIEEFTFKDLREGDGLIVFHDYSLVDHPDNIHCCEYDFEKVYSDLFKKYVMFVHTGWEDFKKEYNELKNFKGGYNG